MSFGIGEEDADLGAPPIETMGARYGIRETMAVPAGRGEPAQPEPYLMPTTHYVDGNMETTVPGIAYTPLGALMPGPFAIPPAVMAGEVGAFPTSDHGEFGLGVADGFPEGCPVPLRP